MPKRTTICAILLLAAAALFARDAGAATAHFTGMGPQPVTFVRLPGDPDAATIVLDEAGAARAAAEAEAVDDAEIIEVIVSYEMGAKTSWRAETAIDPNLEAIFARTGANARLIATSTSAYERDYWFAAAQMAPVVTALRALPQPKGAAIAVLLSNPESLASLKPTPDELRHVRRGARN